MAEDVAVPVDDAALQAASNSAALSDNPIQASNPAALEHHAVQRPVAPRLDRSVNLVQIRHVDGRTRVLHSASVMSSTRRTETPARYISIKGLLDSIKGLLDSIKGLLDSIKGLLDRALRRR
jgi:hypothetical protein